MRKIKEFKESYKKFDMQGNEIIEKKLTEINVFYLSIEKKHTQLMEELMQKDCQRVEFIRGMLCVYSEILKEKYYWNPIKNSHLFT